MARPERVDLGVREKRLRIYSFKELSPKAKKRAVEDVRNDPEMTWDQADSEMLTETFEQDLDDHYGLGDGMEANWSLGYSQGDGVCFKGNVDVGKFITTEKIEGRFGPLVDRIGVKVTHDGRYCHWNSMDVEVETYATEEDLARKEDLELIGEWEDERHEKMERWRMEYAKAREESLAPVREWEERKARREAEWKRFEARRGRGPKAWLPGAPAPFDEPKPAPLPIPLPPEPVIIGPPDVEAARTRVANAWKEFEELVAAFTAHLEDRIKEISREMEKNGYEEIEYHSGDEYITEMLENRDWEYLEDGRRHRD